ncbi:ninein-like protein isoform X2 [Pseudophryne corroboree]|uniref:ninein-like protein isoform X2 n=1 Tax=Pseudophryne corroboree TaxID=495146 RepID=UPI003081CBDA
MFVPTTIICEAVEHGFGTFGTPTLLLNLPAVDPDQYSICYGMDQEEENKYVSQLQEVFNSCDTTGTGFLDKDELTDLCHKLHLEAQLPLLLQTLLGNDLFARVNFAEFKEGFVAVLSSTIDISLSDDDESSYLEPVIPDEVKPKFTKGTKRYGRRTQPEREAAENEANKYLQEQHHVKSQRKCPLRRSSSLESVESLKSEEEAELAKEAQIENFEAQGQLRTWNQGIFESPRRISNSDMTENQVRDIWEELGIGHNGYLNRQELATVCTNIGLEDLSKEELDDLFNKLDRDGDGRVSFQEFQVGLFSHAPLPISSTPLRQRHPWTFYQLLEENSHKTATPSLLSGYGPFHLFSSIDDGSGFGNPEQVMIIWEEQGIEDCREILMSLDFNVEEQVNLLELTTALDNEIISTKNRMHIAALTSYKHELHHQHSQLEQVTKERDKIKQNLDRAEKRNLQLADEVDDHNSVMESLNESKIKDLEQEYKQNLSMIRLELESEKEQFLQQTDQQKKKLETDLTNLQMEEAFLRDKLNLSLKENGRLQKEMVEVVGKLSESESLVSKLQTSIDHMLQQKKLADPHSAELLTQEEAFAEIIRQYEVQCRELRDRNDELQIQLETLRSQLNESKYSRLLAKMKDNKLLHHKAKEKIHHNRSNSDTPAKKGFPSRLRRSMSAAGSSGLPVVTSETSPMTMEAELTKHQVKELQQEIQDLKILLETKVNYYEREIELMKANFEKERKDTEHSFKLEISELEEQKTDVEELNAKYQEVIDGLKEQLPNSAQIHEIERKFEKERTAMEEYYAKEISALGQRLSSEKEQLEEELKRTHQHELLSVREESEEKFAEKLAEIEAQYTEYCQSVMQQHLDEKNKLLQKYELEKKTLLEDHTHEIKQWEEKEKAVMMKWKKDQLKMIEKQNEEQVSICKSFAIEKERLESHYRDHINRLSQEVDGLMAKNSWILEREEQRSVDKRLCDCCVEGNVADLDQQPLSLDKTAGTQLQIVCDVQTHSNTPVVDIKDGVIQTEKVIDKHKMQPDTQNAQNKQVTFSFEWAEVGQSLKEAEESALIKLEEMEGFVASLRAQLQEETKARETLVKHQKGLEEEQAHLISQLKTRENECLISETKAKELMFQLQESCEKQPDRTEDGTLENMYRSLIQNKDVGDLVANKTPFWWLRSKDCEQPDLQGQEGVAMSQCLQMMEEWVTKQVQEAKDELEREKSCVKDQLFQLEDLVRRLEQDTAGSQDHRMELSRLSEDNLFLRNKVERLQQEVLSLEDANKTYRGQVEELKKEADVTHSKLEELSQQHHECQGELSRLNTQHKETIQQLNSKLEELTEQKDEASNALVKLQETINDLNNEKLQQQSDWQRERQQLGQELRLSKQENEKSWDELCQLNAQSLQLTRTISDLTAEKDGNYERLQELNVRLKELAEERHEAVTSIEQLQGQLQSLEAERRQDQAGWHQEREQLETELQISKQENNKVRNEFWQQKCMVSDIKAQNEGDQETIQQLDSRLQVVTEQKEEITATMKKFQEQLSAMEREKERQQTDWQQKKEQLEEEVQVLKDKIQALMVKHKQENQALLNGLDETNRQLLVLTKLQDEVSALRQAKQSLEDQCQSITKLLQEATDQVSQIGELKRDLEQAQAECCGLKRIEDQLRSELEESQDQLLEANTRLTLVQSQHVREVQQLKEKMDSTVPKEQASHLHNRLIEEQEKVQQLHEKLRFHAEQTNRQLAMQREEHEKLLRRMEERMQDVEMNLKNVRVMLQEKVDQLKEQLEKNMKSDLLLKDLYVENAQLMKALQVTEQRQKSAEKKNYLLEDKIAALNKVIRKIAPASLAV